MKIFRENFDLKIFQNYFSQKNRENTFDSLSLTVFHFDFIRKIVDFFRGNLLGHPLMSKINQIRTLQSSRPRSMYPPPRGGPEGP